MRELLFVAAIGKIAILFDGGCRVHSNLRQGAIIEVPLLFDGLQVVALCVVLLTTLLIIATLDVVSCQIH